MIVLRSSATPRAFNCAGSVLMEQLVPPAPDSDDAKEGTAAHWAAEMVLTNRVGTLNELIEQRAPNDVVITDDMCEHVQLYVDHVRSRNLTLMIEQPISFDMIPGVVRVEGTGDSIAFDPITGTLYVDDLKYGYRLVEVIGNWQLFSYSTGGAIRIGPHLVNRVVASIIQPRPHHPLGKIRTWEITGEELKHVWFEAARQRAEQISQPDPQTQTGEHCYYCDAFHACPAAQAAGMNAVDVAGKAVVDDLDGPALASELLTLERAKAMLDNRISALNDLASDRVKKGIIVPGRALEQQFGNRIWSKDADIATLEMLAGVELTEPKPITPAAAERAGVTKEMVKAFTERPSRGWKLVRVDSDAQAKAMFG